MAAGFGALCDQHVGPRFERLPRDREALHLADELRAAAADFFGERARVAEGEHHGTGFVTQREIKQRGVLAEAPGDEADTDALAFSALEFAPDPVGVAVAGAEQPEAA